MDIKERLELKGIKVTLQRVKIYEAIEELDHPTSEEIFKKIHMQ